MKKKNYVLDTSVYLTDYKALLAFNNNDIILPLTVLEEIDKHKKRQDLVGSNARNLIRALDALRNKGSLSKGIKLAPNKGSVFVRQIDDSLYKAITPKDLDLSEADNQIIAVALLEKTRSNKETILVSRDINMRVKCDSLGLKCEEYSVEKGVVENPEKIYTGTTNLIVSDEKIEKFYRGGEVFLENQKHKLYPNQFIMLTSEKDEKKTALTQFISHVTPLKKLNDYKTHGVWGIKPRNREQIYALNLLMDDSIPVVTLIGRSGGGKTILSVASGLEQVLEMSSHINGNGKNKKKGGRLETSLNAQSKYKRLIVSRPVQPVGKDIGYLPGTATEKMMPWLAPIEDNLKYLMGNDNLTLDMYLENGIIELEAITYIRGRSISNAFIIIDEAQNLTIHELKTILTRVGEGTKIVLTGDVEQIDNMYLNRSTNGLSCAVEKFKQYDLFGHITLLKGERSKVATMVSNIL